MFSYRKPASNFSNFVQPNVPRGSVLPCPTTCSTITKWLLG